MTVPAAKIYDCRLSEIDDVLGASKREMRYPLNPTTRTMFEFLLEKVRSDRSFLLPVNLDSFVRLFCNLSLFAFAFYLIRNGLGLLAFFLVGVVQYHFLVMIHEAVHMGLFHPKRLNEFAGEWIGALLLVNFRSQRRWHLYHHKSYGLGEDPDRPAYTFHENNGRTPVIFLFRLSTQIFAGPLTRLFSELKANKPRPVVAVLKGDQSGGSGERLFYILRVICCQLVLSWIYFTFLSPVSYFLFWILPLPLVAGNLSGLRTFLEHSDLGRENPKAEEQFLTVRTTFDDSEGLVGLGSRTICWIIAPFNFNYHHEHHILPFVPYTHLPKLHKILSAHSHYERFPAVHSSSYLRTLAHALQGERAPVNVQN